ncbi:MAG: flavin reductase family protein [Pseudomonadota bacterium]
MAGIKAGLEVSDTFDDKQFRATLGTFSTGVVVVSTILNEKPEGMTIGAFTSVSLAPPLVAFLPAKSSTTWPRIREAASFTVNILAHDQKALCSAFARTSEEKFVGVDWTLSAHGTPHLAGALAWLDCTLSEVFDAGDHDIAVGQVTALSRGEDKDPMVFFGGSFRKLAAPEQASAP